MRHRLVDLWVAAVRLAATANCSVIAVQPPLIRRLICHLQGCSVAQFYQHLFCTVAFDQQLFWQKYEQYLLGRPLSYLTNQVQLATLNLWVDERVLIPRPETYDLAVKLIANVKRNFGHHKQLSILEIGTGSGLISILLGQTFPHARITATDISHHAITVAQYNHRRYHVSNVTLVAGNFLQPLTKLAVRWDVVVCNPPYLSAKEFNNLYHQLHYEPRQALVATHHGLSYYTQMRHIKPWLKHDFIGMMEIGQQQQAAVRHILQPDFKYLHFDQDWQGHPRYVYFHSSECAIR